MTAKNTFALSTTPQAVVPVLLIDPATKAAISLANMVPMGDGGVAITGQSLSAGGSGVLGWLSQIFAQQAAGLQPKGASAYNTAANTAGHQVKNSAGVLHGVTVNIAGLTSSATFYDGTSTGGTKLATVSTLGQTSLTYDIAFATGLFIVLAGGTPADVTVSYF